MKYILDFDEVLFDTSALKAKFAELNISESERGLDVFDCLTEIDPSFEFSSLVFPGALQFLIERGNDCIIVSSATSVTAEHNTDLEKQLAYQTEKIKRSGVEDLAQTVTVVGVSKGEALAEIKGEIEAQGEEMVFVDDREQYVCEASELGIRSVWLDRGIKKGSILETVEGDTSCSNIVRVGSFAAFVIFVDSWK